jgi:hypothetical protein
MKEKLHLDGTTAVDPDETSLQSWVAEEDRLSVLRRTQMLDRPHEAQLDRNAHVHQECLHGGRLRA